MDKPLANEEEMKRKYTELPKIIQDPNTDLILIHFKQIKPRKVKEKSRWMGR